jgi:hypothetical protein
MLKTGPVKLISSAISVVQKNQYLITTKDIRDVRVVIVKLIKIRDLLIVRRRTIC